MNITLKEKNDLNTIFSVEITPEDYNPGVEKTLKRLKNQGSFQGFRKGKVPMGHVKRIYGDQAKIEEVQNLVAKGVEKAVRDNKLSILGQPIMVDQENGIDFKSDMFDITFKVALAPEIADVPNKEDKLPYYEIEVTDKMVDEQVENILKNTPNFIEAEQIEDNDFLSGSVCELDEDEKPKQDGLKKEDNATLLVSMIKDEEEKKKFIGSSVNSVVVFNPGKAFDNSRVEIASLLGVKKEDLGEQLPERLSFEIQKISRNKEAELNQDLFDRVFGEGEVKSEEEMRAKLAEMTANQLKPQSMQKFYSDFKTYFIENKAEHIKVDEETIKDWFRTTEEGLKMLQEGKLDEQFGKMINDLKFYLYTQNILNKAEIKVEDDELANFATDYARMQFARYGMSNLPDEVLQNYVDGMLKDHKQVQDLRSNLEQNKLIDWVYNNVSLHEKKVTPEAFNEMIAHSNESENEDEPVNEDAEKGE